MLNPRLSVARLALAVLLCCAPTFTQSAGAQHVARIYASAEEHLTKGA
ncbi:MAG TPA: hypothetical protein VGC87_13540 [Pyrinomonadaceae bacterium]|jgi:hypothetical protein